MPFADPEKNRAYMRLYMARRRAKLPKKARVYPKPRPKPLPADEVSMVLCSHCCKRVSYGEWAKGEHSTPAPIVKTEDEGQLA